MIEELDEKKESKKESGHEVREWLSRLTREDDSHKNFRKRAEEAIKAYQGSKNNSDIAREGYPIWWSNVKITQSAVFSRQPKPDVRRRITDNKTDKNIALAIERSIAYQQDITPFDEHSNRAVTEFLVAGLGTTRLYLKTETEDVPVINPITGQPAIDEDGQVALQKVIVGQYVPLEYVPYNLFRWEPCKDWEDCQWISFDRWMTKKDIKREFGKDLDDTAGTSSAGYEDKDKPSGQKYANLYLVHEIWDKQKKEIVTICNNSSFEEPLKVESDKYHLKDFFPCPRPMMLNLIVGELTPCPEYYFVKTICTHIDNLSERIRCLLRGIKDIGFYDSAFAELSGLMENSDGARIPVNGLLQKLQGSNLNNVLALEDISSKVAVLVQLVNEEDRAKNGLFELTGIADIVRAASKAYETAAAQQLKAQWANVRLTEKMREISMHFRGVFRIMGEMIAEHFEPQQLSSQAGVEVTPEMIQVLKSDTGRCYAIDIESDSTIAQDEQQEKSDRIEFLNSVTGFISQVMPMVNQNMIPKDLANSMLLFITRSFRHGRMLEEQIEQLPGTQEQLQQLMGQLQQSQQQGEQQAQQSQQVQVQAQQQIQQMQKQMEQLQKTAQSALADQQNTIEQLSAKLQSNNDMVAQAKQLTEMARARSLSAQADKEQAEAQSVVTQNTIYGGL